MESNIGWLLSRAAFSWRNAVDHYMSSLGLTQTRWIALLHLERMGEGCSQKALADNIGIEQPSLLRTLNQLEASNLIQRKSCAEDARRKTLWFTPQGRELLKQVETMANAGRQKMLEGMDSNQRETLHTLLQQVIDNGSAFLRSDHDSR
ncbi:transcriptional regulator SlyA [Salinimonas sp. HHU 13199]|uniref:Transcriptional regulator SlyA n=1 Tax=Salinimonas profundi TaxID=2729140 RepID=A0ABR8LIH9_9ALTE|nr:transcriptional regulator SlyA [Salinimonas profundi]MBD3586034.1 transcriptional regulator SlyA [Salinimonas profundi]